MNSDEMFGDFAKSVPMPRPAVGGVEQVGNGVYRISEELLEQLGDGDPTVGRARMAAAVPAKPYFWLGAQADDLPGAWRI